MKPTTKEQRKAIKRLFDRAPLFEGGSAQELVQKAGWRYVPVNPDMRNPTYTWQHECLIHAQYYDAAEIVIEYKLSPQITYCQFRKTVLQGFDCLMVKWQGMWLGIERDGYTHS